LVFGLGHLRAPLARRPSTETVNPLEFYSSRRFTVTARDALIILLVCINKFEHRRHASDRGPSYQGPRSASGYTDSWSYQEPWQVPRRVRCQYFKLVLNHTPFFVDLVLDVVDFRRRAYGQGSGAPFFISYVFQDV
jgi:hypothetical protein